MAERWINPKYIDLVQLYDALTEDNTMSDKPNCGQCGGVGRHMITDTDGKIKSVTCMACGGSGKQR